MSRRRPRQLTAQNQSSPKAADVTEELDASTTLFDPNVSFVGGATITLDAMQHAQELVPLIAERILAETA